MSFFEQARKKFNEKQFVLVKSLDYLKGAYLKKLNTREVLAMAEMDGEQVDSEDNQEGFSKIAVIIKEHLYDNEKNLAFDSEEGEEFMIELPVGDLMALFKELMDVSGANAQVEELKKK